MKKLPFYLLIGLLTTLTACNRPYRGPVVEQTYVHPYGIEVPPDQWARSGESGQIVSTLKNGVVVTNRYSDGQLDGDTQYTFPHSDNIQKIETYSGGRLMREVHHTLTGTPMKETVYQDGNMKVVTLWYEDGSPQAKETYVRNVLKEAEYYNPNHVVEARVQNGEGSRINRDAYGMIESNDTISEGQLVLRTTYHPNNHPKEVIPYSNGMVHGMKKTYLPAGEPNTIEEWNCGEQTGVTSVYVGGEKFCEISYVNGKKNGMERRFRNGNTVTEEISWVNDIRQGPTYSYVGETKKTDWYHSGKKVTKGSYDLNMVPVSRT